MADFGMAILTQQLIEQNFEKQRQIDSVIQQECLAAINIVENGIVQENIDISHGLESFPGLENDAQTRRFFQFVSAATNFAKMNFAKRLRHLPELINSIKQLLIEMIKEINDFADTARELQDLIHSFIQLVANTQRNMALVIPHLQESINHIEVIADALKPSSTEPLENRDKEDIKIALEGMSTGIEKLLELARTSKKESNNLDEKIAIMKGNIQQKQIVIKGRLEVAQLAPWLGLTVGGFGGFAAAGAAISVEALGGAGVIIVGGMAFPPVFALLVAALLGGSIIGSVVLLVNKLWAKHNTTALDYLNKILDLLAKLSNANLDFSRYMNKAELGAYKILNETDQIQRTITSGSERYRKLNIQICTQAIESTKAMITCIDEIGNVDMSEWTNSSTVLNHVSSMNTASPTKAIKN
ncbi:unnamed protein product [Adineta steineri]|uniref:Uncharacterized protein n=1 Tax=Adineta steineri TaxID=433720 RepID=A0A814SJ83_9BILA|nr:unnamed protein product [Adineta steineri]CAF1148104.1 unnamed protein product [Adineta steineri]